MDKPVKWTNAAIIDRANIYKYWLERNQSSSYSNKLEGIFSRSADTISNFPNIGKRTDYRSVLAKVVMHYKIFYRIESDEIQILRVWDTRQHPDKLKL